jgi:hypothetical protein
MPRSLSMRHIQHSRFMRVLALFAWLMLVTVSMPAAAMDMDAGMSHANAPTGMSAMMNPSMPQAPAGAMHHAGDCCGHSSHPACHCDAMCGNLLLPVLPAVLRSALPTTYLVAFHGVEAPTLDPIPPLRPPAA